MTLKVTTKTAQQVADYVKRQFGDEAGVQITNSDILRWINSGQLEIVTKNEVLKGRATANLVAGQAAYSLPSASVLNIESVHVKGYVVRGYDLAQVEQIISNLDPEQTLTDSVPVLWYEWAGVITFWPTPTESVDNGITLFYTLLPTDVSDLSNTLSIPDKYFEALCSWVMVKAYELDDEFNAADSQRAYFQGKLEEQSEEERRAQNATYPSITIVE